MSQLILIKKAAYAYLQQVVDNKIVLFEAALTELKESVSNETKSTAGDKYETARAMLHIEQENLLRQLSNAQKLRIDLLSLEPITQNKTIVSGSMVRTNNGTFYISIGHGKAVINNHEIIAMSAGSPLGKVLLGLAINDIVNYNSITYTIIEIA
jgi:transcription elongation GreA/GreB family factor